MTDHHKKNSSRGEQGELQGVAMLPLSEDVGSGRDSLDGLASDMSFYRSLSRTTDFEEFRQRIRGIVNGLGFSDFSFSRLASVGDADAQLITVPKEIAENYHAERFYEYDVILKHCATSTAPVRSSVVESYVAGAPVANEIFQRNRELYRMTASFGFYEFFNVPHEAYNGNGNVMLSVTSKGEDPSAVWRKARNSGAQLMRLVEAIDYIGNLKFPDFFLSADESREIRITPKPLQLLAALAKEDLTLNEAADKLCISIHTANQHVAAARKAFGVSTTCGAVYQAIKQRLIVS